MSATSNSPSFTPGDQSALVVIDDEMVSRQIMDALGQLGYDVQLGFSTEDASIKLRSHTYAVVILASTSGSSSLDVDQVYVDAIQIPLEQRRSQFFAMVGPNLRTGDAMQAFSFSMDLVFNTGDLAQFKSALKYCIGLKAEQSEHFFDCLRTMDIAFL